VAAGRRNFQPAFHRFLPFDFGKINLIFMVMLEDSGCINFGRGDFDFLWVAKTP
jgi:hypothetical protein